VVDEKGRELGYYNSTGRDWWDRHIWAGRRMVAQSYDNPAATYFLHANGLGSDSQITDPSGRVKTDFIDYPWQNWTSKSSPFSCLPPALCVHTSTLPGPCTQ
jgi:hypothetical protein